MHCRSQLTKIQHVCLSLAGRFASGHYCHTCVEVKEETELMEEETEE